MMRITRFGIGAALLVIVFLPPPVTGVLADSMVPGEQTETKKAKDQEPATVIGGIVVDGADKPVSGAEVELKRGQAIVRAVSQSDGKFQMTVAEAPKYGFNLLAKKGERLAFLRVSGRPSNDFLKSLRLELKPERRVDVTVADGKGQPVGGARAGAMSNIVEFVAESLTDAKGRATLRVPADIDIWEVFAWKGGVGFDYRSFVKTDGEPQADVELAPPPAPPAAVALKLDGARTLRVTILDGDGRPIPKMLLYPRTLEKSDAASNIHLSGAPEDFGAVTDEHGVATWDWLPTWQKRPLVLWPSSKEYAQRQLMWQPKNGASTATFVLYRLQTVRGRVTHADGSPAANILIRAGGAGYDHDEGYHTSAKTDAQGKYELRVAPQQLYLIVVDDKKWAASPQTGFAVLPKTPVPDKDFVLRPATVIKGKVTIGKGKEEKPHAGQHLSLNQSGVDNLALPDALPNPEKSRLYVQPSIGRSIATDADGCFEFRVGPGKYHLFGPSRIKPVEITVTDQKQLEFDLNAPRVEMGRLTGMVVTGMPPAPVANAVIQGIYRGDARNPFFAAKANADGRFEAQRLLHPLVLHARHPNGQLAGMVEIGPDDATVTIPLLKVASAQGRLIDGETGLPLADRKLVYGVRVYTGEPRKSPFFTAFGGETTTDSEGRFELNGLVAGQKYSVDLSLEKGWRSRQLHTLIPSAGESVKLGDLKLLPEPKPKTDAEIRLAAFDVKGTPIERFEAARRDAVLSRQHVLVIFASPKEPATEKLFALIRDRDALGDVRDDFRMIWMATDVARLPAAQALATKLRCKPGALTEGVPMLVIADTKGEPLATGFEKGGMLDAHAVRKFLEGAAPERLNADKLLADALAQAKKENKRVLVQETATWCGPCWMLSRFLDKHRPIWEKDYIWVKMDHRWTNASKIMAAMRNKAEGGVPWTAILDADGKVLATCNAKDGHNIGFPSEADSIAHFATMLRTTAIRLTPREIGELAEALKAADRP